MSRKTSAIDRSTRVSASFKRTALARWIATTSLVWASTTGVVAAADQTQIGAGNATAVALATRSPLVDSAMRYLIRQADGIQDRALRAETLDILRNDNACVVHRIGLASTAAQDAIIQQLMDQKLISPTDAAAFPSGVRAAIFPPIVHPEAACPQLPQPFTSAPGSAFNGHHSFPGGLPVHEANNDRSDTNLESQYQASFGHVGPDGFPKVARDDDADDHDQNHGGRFNTLPIDHDVILAAPIWHDWAKSIVFQWNADGTEFAEFNFGGAGTTDAYGAVGDSRTGGHHILSIAESMSRKLSPLMVVTQASAHSAPTLGNEYKVVNWLRAAAIIARIDPVARGYLVTDAAGRLRLPALGRLGDVNLNVAGETNLRVEYTLHNLSDADFTFSIPAITSSNVLLKTLAPEFGYGVADLTTYNTRYRNPAYAYLSGERLLTIYGSEGLDGVRRELTKLKARGVI